MVDITIYPACLDCPNTKFGEWESEMVVHFNSSDERIQRSRCDHERVCMFIEGQEPIDLKPKTCEFIIHLPGDTVSYCTNCGAMFDICEYVPAYDFCPKCGAEITQNMPKELME